MSGPIHDRLLALLRNFPELAVALWVSVEPEVAELLAKGWIVRVRDNNLPARGFSPERRDRHRLGDLVLTLHPADDPEGPPKIVLVVECQLVPDHRKRYVWVEYLAAARRIYETIGRVLVMSHVDDVLLWAHELFAREPHLRPLLVGRQQVPFVDDRIRALREPGLAVLSALFHGPHEGGEAVVSAAALALRSFPPHKRDEYAILLGHVLSEDRMDEIRRVTYEQAQKAADDMMRATWPFRAGHREGLEEGLEEGREQGREQGLVQGRREAIALLFELRGLVPSASEQARIDACTDHSVLERWCRRAKTSASVAELFEGD